MNGMVASVLIGAIICCSSAIAGDNMQDLKTGHLIKFRVESRVQNANVY